MRKCKQLVALLVIFTLLLTSFAAFAVASEPVSYIGSGSGELRLELIGIRPDGTVLYVDTCRQQ
jgi:hypothetical protein